MKKGGKRKKKKEMNYEMKFESGEIVEVLDEEDRKNKEKLMEDWKELRRGGRKIECVKEKIIIGKLRRKMIKRMFEFEYEVMFRGIMKWIERRGMVIKIGGK